MAHEVEAAAIGGVIGSFSVWLFNIWDKSCKEKQDTRSAFEMFKHFHEKCMEVDERYAKHQGKYQALVPGLTDLVPYFIQNASVTIKQAVLEYQVEFAELRTYSQAGSRGLFQGPLTKMKQIFETCQSKLIDEGIISPLTED